MAAQVVQRIFQMAASGVGQIRIAKNLNEKGVPCPSDYKRLMGMKYRNSHQLPATHYWTYATVHRILRNQMYLGHMVQAKAVRTVLHGKAAAVDESEWITVKHTHEAIVSQDLWDTVQAQISKNTRGIDFQQNVGLFAGFLKCGDCGRALCKTTWKGRITYSCGSYRRYGATVCSAHYIRQQTLEKIVLQDLNTIISTVENLEQAAEKVIALLQTYVNETGQKWGPVCTQCFFDGTDVEVCEITARFFGFEHELVTYSSGLDMEELLLDLAYSPEKLEETFARHNPRGSRHAAVVYLQSVRSGVLADQSRLEQLAKEPWVEESILFYRPGDSVGVFGPQPYFARYYVTADTREALDEKTGIILERAGASDENGQELLFRGGCETKSAMI